MASLKELLREMIYKINKAENEKVSSVNGIMPDENGNVEITIPESSGGNVDLSNYYTKGEVDDLIPEVDYPVTSVNGQTGAVQIDIPAVPTKVSAFENDKSYATETFVTTKIAEAQLSGEEVDLSGYATKDEIPEKVSELENDSGYLTEHQSLAGYAKTTDHYTKTESDGKYQPKGNYLTEHQDISGKLDASALPTAINTALAQAKASGDFKGEPGDDYVLTEVDKQEIAEMAAELVEVPDSGQNPTGGGMSATAVNLLIAILQNAVFTSNQTGNIAALQEALASGGSGGDTPDVPDIPDTPDEPVTDDIAVANGIMTIISVGSEIAVSGGVMTIA